MFNVLVVVSMVSMVLYFLLIVHIAYKSHRDYEKYQQELKAKWAMENAFCEMNRAKWQLVIDYYKTCDAITGSHKYSDFYWSMRDVYGNFLL